MAETIDPTRCPCGRRIGRGAERCAACQRDHDDYESERDAFYDSQALDKGPSGGFARGSGGYDHG